MVEEFECRFGNPEIRVPTEQEQKDYEEYAKRIMRKGSWLRAFEQTGTGF